MRFGSGIMKEISTVTVWSSRWQVVVGKLRVVPVSRLLR
jgi:hypothetical protein